MSDLIKREDAIRTAMSMVSCIANTYMLDARSINAALLSTQRCLERIMPVDAVSVIRCRECKHKYQEPWSNGVAVEGECEIWHNATLDNDFCSYGERKTNDQGRTAGKSNIK